MWLLGASFFPCPSGTRTDGFHHLPGDGARTDSSSWGNQTKFTGGIMCFTEL